MIRVCRNRYLLCTVLAWMCGTGYSQVPDELFIQKALHSPATIHFQNITLENAIAKVSASLGVPLEPEPSALNQLPGGPLLLIESVQLEGMTWRDALRELLEPLSLTYQVGTNQIYILGTPELMRQPRQLNLMELNALVTLQTIQLNDSEDNLLKQIRELSKLPFEWIEFGDWEEKAEKDITERILTKHPTPAVQVLDRYSRSRGKKKKQPIQNATWYVRESAENSRAPVMYIEILPAEQLLLMKLDRRTTVSYHNQPAQKIFLDLAQRANVEIRFEPGCLALLEPRTRNNILLEMQTATIKGALDALEGMTGLEYKLQADHIRIQASANLVEMAKRRQLMTRSSGTNPAMTVITVKVPGTEMEVMMFVRKEDLEEMGLQGKFQQYYLDSVKTYFDFLKKYEPK